MTTEQMNKAVAEWLGVQLHHIVKLDYPCECACGYTCKTIQGIRTHTKNANPDFSIGAGIIRLLEEMTRRGELHILVLHACAGKITPYDFIIECVTTPGKLLQAAWEWSKRTSTKGGNNEIS